jgi:hypothetical protein
MTWNGAFYVLCRVFKLRHWESQWMCQVSFLQKGMNLEVWQHIDNLSFSNVFFLAPGLYCATFRGVLLYDNCWFTGCNLWVRVLTYSWTHICLQDRICDSRWCSVYPSYCEGDIDLCGTTPSPKNNDTATKERAGDGHHTWAWPWKVDHTSYILSVFLHLYCCDKAA